VDAAEPDILLLHDGELADVAALLRELGAVFRERHAEIDPDDAKSSFRLVVASARRALELPSALLRESAFRIAILDGDSRTVRALLRRARFELVVRRPVHPLALRLVLLHALYRGPEKRRTRRVSVGAQVQVRAGLRRHRAVLADISERGCRLLTSLRANRGQLLTLQIPASVSGGRAFSVKGRVVRSGARNETGPGAVTLSFSSLSKSANAQLNQMVSLYAAGPSALAGARRGAHPAVPAKAGPPVPPATAPEPAPPLVEAAPAPPAEPVAFEPEPPAPPLVRRRGVALNAEASRVLLARDLSREGMRADRSRRLPHGAALSLALHAEPDAPPLTVRVRVEQAEDEDAAWLRFEDLAAADGDRLSAMLASLSLFAGSDRAEHALVVCEILDAG
jgi:hypothetical protein